ncbi:4Fe-4S ferredoxin [Candidatus Fermentibacteria bacterium]|nr:MAG: 4Fe-4S ferredoxin [Candidatus Fermentibacteria bacterium]
MSEKPAKGQTKVEPSEVKRKPAVHIFPDWCKGCGICIAFCPKQVLAMGKDQKARVAHPEKCIECALCARRCPEFAVFVSGEELKNSRKNGGEK